jgi:hypothetical protein
VGVDGKKAGRMNERIKELLTPKLKEWGGASSDNFSEELEKFAELIIMECLTICEELGDKGMDGHYCADEISKTFRR